MNVVCACQNGMLPQLHGEDATPTYHLALTEHYFPDGPKNITPNASMCVMIVIYFESKYNF
jgi:hypothetical protein